MGTNKKTNPLFKQEDNALLLTGYTNLDSCRNMLTKFPFLTMMLHKKGYAKVQINFEEYYITEHTQVIMISHSTISVLEVSDDFEVIYICFKPSELMRVGIKIDNKVLGFIKNKPCYHHHPQRFAIITSLAELILHFNEEKDNEYKNRIINNLLQTLFLDLTDKVRKSLEIKEWDDRNTGRHDELFKKFMWLVHNNCIKEREVKFYAEELCISPRYLSTIVKDITKTKTAKQIIDDNVIAEIKYILDSTDMQIKDIVEHLHFADASFLGKYFRKHTGMTLLEYRS